MKIEKFLEKINYKIKYGEIYTGQELKNKLLYWIFFTNKSESNNGKLLLSAKNTNIYLIKYETNEINYFYKNEILNYKKKNNNEKQINLRTILKLIENN